MNAFDLTDRSFAELGKPEHVGHAFAITKRMIDEMGIPLDEIVDALPRPTYEHKVWLDMLTDNIIVVRPDKDGKYEIPDARAKMRLLR